MRHITFATIVSLLVLACGCGGHGPTMPSPDDGGDQVNVTDFIVEAGEVRRFDTDTEIQAAGIVRIDGEVIGADGSAAGDDGVSITIEAAGNITVTGVVKAGEGMDGSDRTGRGAGEDGGDGGSVTLRSTGGDITIGMAGDAEVEAATSAATRLAAGDGGDGGEGLVGGAGGQGGSVTFECDSGTLTINQTPGLLHAGNGGHGGLGVIRGDEDVEFEVPEQIPSHGGNGGLVHMDAAELQGARTETVEGAQGEPSASVVLLDEAVADGGAGGDGGDFFAGVDPETGRAVWSLQPEAAPASTGVSPQYAYWNVHRGTCGGDGYPTAGNGGNVTVEQPPATGTALAPDDVTAVGGLGGSVFVTPWQGLFGSDEVRAGDGGNAKATGAWGESSSTCGQGGRGGDAEAQGGRGGVVLGDLSIFMTVINGNGGDAEAIGGDGGHAGDCCTPGPYQGHPGGRGGWALASGGHAGQTTTEQGFGGDAIARGGKGGDGGDGVPPGEPGEGSEATAVAGEGKVPGGAVAVPGEPGAPGNACQVEPPPPTDGYGVVVSDSPRETIFGFLGIYDPGPGPNQLQPGFTLGGPNHPVIAWVGQSMIFSPDNSRLWVGNELGGMSLYRNPLTNGGDRAPDLVLHIAGTQWYSIWYEAQSDTLYATTMNSNLIYAWDSASTGNANRAPDRTIEVPGYHGQGYLIGAHGSNTLLMAARVHNIERFVVFYDADQLDGLNAADRYFEPEDFNVAFTHALSWDATRNLLYYVVPDRNEIRVYANASNLTGAVTPDRVINVPNVDGQDWITGAIVSSADDLLFVSTFEGQIMVFANASGLQGTPQPATTQTVGDMALGLGVFRQ